MAPNKRGGPLTSSSVISKEEVAARGAGTKDAHDVYDSQQWVRSEVRVVFTGLMFLTRLPCPAWVDHHPALLMRSMCWFPLIGVLIGAWGAAFFSAAAVLWPPSIAAAVSTLATVWLTGAFHEDGLADVFDGFGGGWGKVQILRIMKDSRVGTYALVGVALVLHAKLHALASLHPADVWPVMVAAHCASRWTCVPLVYCCTYIQDDEDAKQALYNWYAQSQRLLTPIRLLLATLATACVPLILLGPAKAFAVYATLLVITAAAGYYGTAVIGGVMGDFLGATIQVSELAIYCVLLADWSALAGGGWVQLAMLGAVVSLPVMYCRRIVDFTTSC